MWHIILYWITTVSTFKIYICKTYLSGQEVYPHSCGISATAGHLPFFGNGVVRHLFSRIPEKSYIPRIPKRTMINKRKTTTFPKSGREEIKDYTSSLIPIRYNLFLVPLMALMLLSGRSILIVRIAETLVELPINDKKLVITTIKSMIFQQSFK